MKHGKYNLFHISYFSESNNVYKNYVGSVYVGGYGGLSESGLCVFRELGPAGFLVDGESPSVLLSSVVMSYVNCGNYG